MVLGSVCRGDRRPIWGLLARLGSQRSGGMLSPSVSVLVCTERCRPSLVPLCLPFSLRLRACCTVLPAWTRRASLFVLAQPRRTFQRQPRPRRKECFYSIPHLLHSDPVQAHTYGGRSADMTPPCTCVYAWPGTPQLSTVSESGSREDEAKTLRNVLRTEYELQNLTVRLGLIRAQRPRPELLVTSRTTTPTCPFPGGGCY